MGGWKMKKMPIIETKRLILRPFNLSDAKDVQRLAGHERVYETTLNIPHPYEDGMAEEWISKHQEFFEKEQEIALAITDKKSGNLVGGLSLFPNRRFDRAEVAYFIGYEFWNNGFATEALKGIIEFGFKNLNLNRIYAMYFINNKASGKVMKKAGMRYEGLFRQHLKKGDKYYDLEYYGILKEDYDQQIENEIK